VARGRKKRRGNVYGTNVERLSVYPSYRETVRKQQEEEKKRSTPQEGAKIRVRITGMDDDGNPTGTYMGYTVVIDGGVEAEPGLEVQVVIKKVRGRTIYARPVS